VLQFCGQNASRFERTRDKKGVKDRVIRGESLSANNSAMIKYLILLVHYVIKIDLQYISKCNVRIILPLSLQSTVQLK